MGILKTGPNKRICAFLIDSVIGEVIGIILSLLLKREIDLIIWAVYILLKDVFKGQSIGRYLVGLQVVDKEGEPARYTKTIIRNIFMIIPLFPIIEYFVMLRDDLGERVGDKVAKTEVNDLNPEKKDITYLWISISIVILFAAIRLGLGFLIMGLNPELLNENKAREILREAKESGDYQTANKIENFLNAARKAREAEALAAIKTISTAIEVYKVNKGNYPLSEDELIDLKLSYVDLALPYDNKTVDGYRYSVRLNPQGYKITAEPAECGISGTKIFIAETDYKQSEYNCK